MGEGVVSIYIYMGVCMGYRGGIIYIYIIYRGVGGCGGGGILINKYIYGCVCMG